MKINAWVTCFVSSPCPPPTPRRINNKQPGWCSHLPEHDSLFMRYICTQRLDSAYLSHLAKEAATVFQDKTWVNLELSSQVVCCVTLWMNTRAIIYKAGLGVVNNKIYFTVLFGFFCFAQVKEKCFAFGCTQWQLDFFSCIQKSNSDTCVRTSCLSIHKRIETLQLFQYFFSYPLRIRKK